MSENQKREEEVTRIPYDPVPLTGAFVELVGVDADDIDCLIPVLETGYLERDISANSNDPGGRPTKLTTDFLAAAEAVLNKDINAIICTDEELLMLINERLEVSARIDERTLERWKVKNKDGQSETEDIIGVEFCRLIKKALSAQKANLFEKLRNTPDANWQRFAWIIERKFDAWNIRNKSELSGPGGKPIPIAPVVAGDDLEKYSTADLEKILEKIEEKPG